MASRPTPEPTVNAAEWKPGLPPGEPATQKYEVVFTPAGAIWWREKQAVRSKVRA